MNENFANEFQTTLTANMLIGDSTASVASVTGAPVVPFRIKINAEYMLVMGIVGTTLTVTRAQEGTAAAAHTSGDDVIHVLTAEGLSSAGNGNPSRQIYLYDECAFRAATTPLNHGFVQTASGGSTFNDASVINHPGVIALQTGSTSNGRVALTANMSVWLGSQRMRFGCVARLGYSNGNFASDATQPYYVWMGWGTNFPSAQTATGVLFRNTHDVNSGRWEAVTRDVAVETAVDTGVAGDFLWHRFEIEINAAGTEAIYFIDGVQVATITTNIPPSSIALVQYPIVIYKNLVGTSSRFCAIDAFWYQYDLNTPR